MLVRRSRLVAAAAALVAPLTLSTLTALPAQAAPERTVTLVGSLQSELGCAADWQPACT